MTAKPANAELLHLAEEQRALLRVAELVAGGAQPRELFDAVAREASRLVGDEPTMLGRFEGPRTYTVLAGCRSPVPIGTRIHVPPDDEGLVAAILATRSPARLGDYRTLPGPAYARDDFGVLASVGVPILVEDRLWGFVCGTSGGRRFPADAEQRLGRFAGIITSALANVAARTQLEELADEQAALRRVAELVARAAPPAEVFTAVATEASGLVGGERMAVARFAGEGEVVIVASRNSAAPLGERIAFGPDTMLDRVRRRSAVVRVDDFGTERNADHASVYGLTAAVSAPIVVADEVWGVLSATSAEQPLPAGTEARLKQFAQLIASALGNSRARAELQAMADEQAALRQVAELAARDAPEDEVLQEVAAQASRLTGVDFTTLLRYDADGSTEIVALDGAPDGVVVGMRAPATGEGAVQQLWQTGRAARVDNLAGVSGRWPGIAAGAGYAASAAVPIVIRGALWGALVVVARHQPLPRGIEDHLANFADLVGTAISAADARKAARALADEQAALRRVAELVARGAAPDEVFVAVTNEASALLGDLAAALMLYDEDGAVVVASCNCPAPVGLHVPFSAGTAVDQLFRTGRPAQVRTYEGTTLASVTRELGIASTTAVPITVEGRVRAALVSSSSGPVIPAGVEACLTPFAELAAVAIANAETKAKLTASRARVVATADETRRRLQRDVHDGAQQRLVHTIIALKLARDAQAAGHPATDLIDEALTHAERANRELRDIVHGILPAALTHGGLRTGLESLVADLTLPVDVHVAAPRLPPPMETTAYFVVAEALTNVVKHARARRASVHVAFDSDALTIEVRDDGIGGADPARGTGLTGLLDRIDAAEGSLTITSPAGAGTTLLVILPVDPPTPSGQPDPARQRCTP